MYAFGKMMRKLMKERGVKQSDICGATGISKQKLSLICQGKTQYPAFPVCKKIADYFGLSLDELYALMEAEES